MKHCSQCGTNVNPDAKFCENCGASLSNQEITDNAHASASNVNANLKVALTNETTEKVMKGVGSSFSSIVSVIKNTIKKLVMPVIILSIVGGIGTGVVAYILYEREKAEYRQEKEQEEKAMTFEKEKAFGTFQIVGMSVNGRYVSYGSTDSPHYSDSWPYNDPPYNQRPTGKVTISNSKMTIHIDLNRDNKLSAEEKMIFKIKSISKSKNPDDYRYGFIETDVDDNVNFIINSWVSRSTYNLIYSIGDDSYKLWLE